MKTLLLLLLLFRVMGVEMLLLARPMETLLFPALPPLLMLLLLMLLMLPLAAATTAGEKGVLGRLPNTSSERKEAGLKLTGDSDMELEEDESEEEEAEEEEEDAAW